MRSTHVAPKVQLLVAALAGALIVAVWQGGYISSGLIQQEGVSHESSSRTSDQKQSDHNDAADDLGKARENIAGEDTSEERPVFLYSPQSWLEEPITKDEFQPIFKYEVDYREMLHNIGFSRFTSRIPTPSEAAALDYFVYKKDYQHKSEAVYFDTHPHSEYQISVYTIAAEMCRRTQCTAIVDIGCGEATKLNTIKTEILPDVRCIGLDFGSNLDRARQEYPALELMELDLSIPNCTLDIDKSVLAEAVVISADVIEHIVDPSTCFLPLFTHLSSVSKAVIVSSPDRHIFHGLGSSRAKNKHHIREWTIEEAETMFLAYHMYPLVSGWVCSNPQKCRYRDDGFNKHTTFLTLSTNADDLLADSSEARITVFMVVQAIVSQPLVEKVTRYYLSEEAEVVLILVGETSELPTEDLCKQMGVKCIMSDINMKNIQEVIQDYVQAESDPNTWFILTEAHEVILPRDHEIHQTTLKHALSIIGPEYNAVGLSILFRHSPETPEPWGNRPFKMYASHIWDIQNAYAEYYPLENRVRIWRNTAHTLTFSTLKTVDGIRVISEIYFEERKVYPCNLISNRFNPSFVPTTGPGMEQFLLSARIERNYCLEFAVGCLPNEEMHLRERELLY